MTPTFRTLALLITALAGTLTLAACKGRAASDASVELLIAHDWDKIKKRDTLTVATTFNSTSYFIYKGEARGYEYELLQNFAEENDVELRTVVVRDEDSLYTLLNNGTADIAAARITPASIDTERVAITASLYETRPVVVQRTRPLRPTDLPGGADAIAGGADSAEVTRGLPQDAATIRARLVRSPEQLAGREVHVSRSAVYDRLVELSDDLSRDIEIVEVEGQVSPEGLMRQVAEGEIELTATHENIASLSADYYNNLEVKPSVGDLVPVVFAVRRNAPQLREALSGWIRDEKQDGLVASLYKKYYVDRSRYKERVASEYLSSRTGKLSAYDDLIKANAHKVGWDWRLLASQMYQESKFDPQAQSWAGATGLLQLMPATAREYGVTNSTDPQQNVEGAVRFLQWLTSYWAKEIPDPQEQLKFVLASYNAGHGHLEDARRMTAKNKRDPNKWADVSFWLLQLSQREHYTDPVVKYGFVRGLEPVTYVSIILDRFDHYRQFVSEPAQPPVAKAELR